MLKKFLLLSCLASFDNAFAFLYDWDEEICKLFSPCKDLSCNPMMFHVPHPGTFVSNVSKNQFLADNNRYGALLVGPVTQENNIKLQGFLKEHGDIFCALSNMFSYDGDGLNVGLDVFAMRGYLTNPNNFKNLMRIFNSNANSDQIALGVMDQIVGKSDFVHSNPNTGQGVQIIGRALRIRPGKPGFEESLSDEDKKIFVKISKRVRSLKEELFNNQGVEVSDFDLLHELAYRALAADANEFTVDEVKFFDNYYHLPRALSKKERRKNFQKIIRSSLKLSDPIARAAYLHMEIVKLHPFADGNGRFSRLLMNAALVNGGYPPVVMFSDLAYNDIVWGEIKGKQGIRFEDFLRDLVCKTAESMNINGNELYGFRLAGAVEELTQFTQQLTKRLYDEKNPYWNTLSLINPVLVSIGDVEREVLPKVADLRALFYQYKEGYAMDESVDKTKAFLDHSDL
jgi:hypothetical protein